LAFLVSKRDHDLPLSGISEKAQQIMGRLLRMPPEPQKDAPPPPTTKGEAQRRRRLAEKHERTGDGGH